MLRIAALVCVLAYVASSPLVQDEKRSFQCRSVFPEHQGSDRNSIQKSQRWPNGRIPYTLAADFSQDHEKLIREVMDYVAEKTCVKFEKKTGNDKTYLDISNGPGCMSYIGYSSMYTNMTCWLNINQCMVFGVILHELTHAIGFFHEHARIDRDDYVEIHWENILPQMVSEFKKVDPEKTTTFNDFEYESIMMYDDLSFSKDPYKGLKTMTPKKPGVVLKGVDKKKYTASDIYRIKQMYCP